MAELDLTTVFNDCVDRIIQGQSIDDCLRRYPQYAATLRPMLETGLLVQRMRVQPAEVLTAQTHVRQRFEDALRAPTPRHTSGISRFIYALAAILLIAFVAVGSLTALSQDSLPGDSLYRAKLFSEGLQRSLFDNDTLETNFNQRRIHEIQQLIALGRTEDVTFSGTITMQNASDWIIESLPISVSPDVLNAAAAHIGDKVNVTAHTSESHTLTALSIQIIQPAATPQPTLITPTQTPSATATATLTLTPTLTPTQPLPNATVLTPTLVPQITVTASAATACVPIQPAGWVAYQIRSGDTLSVLASGQSISLAELMMVNCITDARRIVVGETIFLPSAPSIVPTIVPSSDQGSGSNNSGSNVSGNPNPNPTDDHGGGDDHGGHGGSDNSGSGSSGSGGSDDHSGPH